MAMRFAESTLGHIDREYPHGLAHVMDGPETITPAGLHPIFHGSYDWHSCVHGWWQLLKLCDIETELTTDVYPRAAATFTEENVSRELAYLQAHPSFERPYGWAWLLALHGESHKHNPEWAETLRPLADHVAKGFAEYLPKLTYPVRAGTHANTAFALIAAYGWSTIYDPLLGRQIQSWAKEKFQDDINTAHQEPSGEDFLSPTLTEALLMARVLPQNLFEPWQEKFMPELPVNLLGPVLVTDRTDGRIGHLDGLNLSRAWAWRALAWHLPKYQGPARTAADRHLEAALPNLNDGYMAEHWLTTFAVLAMTQR